MISMWLLVPISNNSLAPWAAVVRSNACRKIKIYVIKLVCLVRSYNERLEELTTDPRRGDFHREEVLAEVDNRLVRKRKKGLQSSGKKKRGITVTLSSKRTECSEGSCEGSRASGVYVTTWYSSASWLSGFVQRWKRICGGILPSPCFRTF